MTLNESIAPTTVPKEASETSTQLLDQVQSLSEEISVATFEEIETPIKEVAPVDAYTESADDLSSLKRFLAKPRFMGNHFLRALIRDYGTIVSDFSEYFKIFAITTKVLNYTGIRFTMCAKVVFSVTPFDSGQVVLSYLPPYYYLRNDSINSIECFRHVPSSEADLNETTSVELRIPFYSPKRFLLTTDLGKPHMLGTFEITTPMDNIAAMNSSDCKLYFWIEDVELLYPTNHLPTAKSDPTWFTQGPESQNIKGGQVVLTQKNYDTNYQITTQAVPACLNLVSKDYSDGATESFYELFTLFSPVQQYNIAAGQEFQHAVHVRPNEGEKGNRSFLALSNLFFKFYSGSIKYRLKIFKTKFHSGRMQIAFLPRWGQNSIPDNLDDFWNIIWDFRESSEIEFSIPYVDDKFATLTTHSQGRLVFKLITELQCPDTVTQNINLLLESAADDDFKVYAPYSGRVLQHTYVGEEQPKDGKPIVEANPKWKPQGPKTIADKEQPSTDNYMNESDCSISELVSKASYATYLRPAIEDRTTGIYLPPAIPLYHYNTGSRNDGVSNVELLANLFQFYRGDVVCKGYNYYTAVDEQASDFPVYPYICNLRYNEARSANTPPPSNLLMQRLHNGRFFYPWYTINVKQIQ